MEINEYVERALTNTDEELVFVYKGLSLPIYGTMPDFGPNEPEAYIVYSAYNFPAHYADDTYLALEHNVTVNIFTQSIIKGLEKAIRKSLEAHNFEYQGNGTPTFESDYPQKRRAIQEYKISIEEE